MDKNPFVISGYAGDRFFCDREKETAMLKDYIDNGINVTLISPRRIGKTGLVEHLFQQKDIMTQYQCFLVDIFATKNIDEMVQQLGKSIVKGLVEKEFVTSENGVYETYDKFFALWLLRR